MNTLSHCSPIAHLVVVVVLSEAHLNVVRLEIMVGNSSTTHNNTTGMIHKVKEIMEFVIID